MLSSARLRFNAVQNLARICLKDLAELKRHRISQTTVRKQTLAFITLLCSSLATRSALHEASEATSDPDSAARGPTNLWAALSWQRARLAAHESKIAHTEVLLIQKHHDLLDLYNEDISLRATFEDESLPPFPGMPIASALFSGADDPVLSHDAFPEDVDSDS